MADLSFDDLVPQNSGGQPQPLNFSDLQPSYRGSILPFSTDQQGNPRLDWSAGIPGQIASAFKAPGDVFSGAQATPYSGGGASASPENINSALNFAASFTPVEGGTKLPSAADLKNAATAGYNAFRDSGLEFHGQAINDLAQSIKQNLESDGIIAEHAPQTFAAINKAIADTTPSGAPGETNLATPANMQAVRRSLTNVDSSKTDIEAARRAKSSFDQFLSGPPDSAVLSAPPQGAPAAAQLFSDANANFAASQRSNALTGSLDRANTGIIDRAEARAAASHSGQNLDNSVRSRVASFLEKPENVAGLTDPEINELNDVVNGSWLQNRLRWVGNTLGGGGGLGHLIAGMGGIAGAHALGPEGAGIGLAVPAIGVVAKNLENALARRSLDPVDAAIRARSPLYNNTQMALPPTFTPSGMMTRGLLPGLLNQNGLLPQQPLVPGATPGQPIPAGLLANWS